MTAPHLLPLAEAAALIAARRLSPVELLADRLARIEALEPRLNTVIRLVADEAMAAARAAEAEITSSGPRTPLHGIPVGLKDIIDLEGHPTTCHSKLQLDRVATADAVVVARLRAAGAVFPAKLATLNSPSAARPSTCPSRRRATPGTPRIIRAAPPPAPAPRSPRGCCRRRWGRIPAGRCATRPRIAGWSG